MLPLEFVVFATPLSQRSENAKQGGPWQSEVKSAAGQHWTSSAPAAGDFAVSITYLCNYFQAGGQQPDSDNIAKPIVDALRGLIYNDDASVTDVLIRRRVITAISPSEGLSALLIDCLSRSTDCVHVVVDNAPISEVHLQWKI